MRRYGIKDITLTDNGILLKRRALEIINIEERTLAELKGSEEVIEGTAKYWREDILVQRKLYPEIAAGTVIEWRRNTCIFITLFLSRSVSSLYLYKHLDLYPHPLQSQHE